MYSIFVLLFPKEQDESRSGHLMQEKNHDQPQRPAGYSYIDCLKCSVFNWYEGHVFH